MYVYLLENLEGLVKEAFRMFEIEIG
jgi:hypothetical protein